MAQFPLSLEPDRDAPLNEGVAEVSIQGVVNRKELLERCMGNLDIAERMLQAFEESFPKELVELEEALKLENVEELARAAHRVRGSSANVAAESMHQAAAKIEELCRAGHADEIPAQVDRLRCEWAEYLARPPFACSTVGSPCPSVQATRDGRASGPGVSTMRVLIVEDDALSAKMLQSSLVQFGYDVGVARDGREALENIRSGQYRLVISDWQMPKMTGVELCRHVREECSGGYIYFILLTSRQGTQSVVEGLDAGADDFLTKPYHPQELRLRLRTGERILGLGSRELIIFSLAKLAESRDKDTGAHLERIREYCRLLAVELSRQEKFRGQMGANYVQLIHLTSPLHDIGKVGTPDRVLLKPGRLTEEEFEIMKQHTVIGSETLSSAARAYPEAEFLWMARDISRSHHEKFDGSGYPDGLAGEDIPLCGRIVALADVYDALTTKRVYKPAFSPEKSRAIILDGRGSHFDPDVVDVFLANEDRFAEIRRQFQHGANELQSLSVPSELVAG
jgi:cyclic di-GMP phosphodiesterase